MHGDRTLPGTLRRPKSRPNRSAEPRRAVLDHPPDLGNGRQILIAGANWCSGGCGMHDAGRAELDKP